VQMLGSHGYDELHAGGNSLIMADVMIAYKGEAFYGDELTIKIYAEEITDRSFDLLYHISTCREGMQKDVAHAKTGMACFDYETRKIATMREELRRILI
jgi:acyl-CoA thioester hydrolase